MRSAQLSMMLVMLTALASGCGGDSKRTSGSPGMGSNEVGTAAFQAVPAGAIAVAAINSPRAFFDFLTNSGFFPMDFAIGANMQADLQAHIEKLLGLDFTTSKTLIGAALPLQGKEPRGIAVLYPVLGKLQNGKEEAGATLLHPKPAPNLLVAMKDNYLIAGDEASVHKALATLAGESPAFLGSGEFSKFFAAGLQGGGVQLSADLSQLPIPPNPFTGDLKFASVTLTGQTSTFRARVQGEHQALQSLAKQLDGLFELGLGMAKQAMAGNSGDLAKGAGAILAYYNLKNLKALLQPKVDGNELSMELALPLGENAAMIAVSGIGILSAVAIPSFIKYMRKAKTIEAMQFTRKISSGVRAYYERTDHLPEPIPVTPAKGLCCAGKNGECAANRTIWQTPAWQALGFSLGDSHYYSYELSTTNKSYTVIAYGDLDCDGIYSTYTMYGEVINGELQTADDILKMSPLE